MRKNPPSSKSQRFRQGAAWIVSIRPETASDAAAIEAVTIEAFRSAGHSSGTEPDIVNALRKDGQLTVSLVARQGGSVVGHVAVSPVSISDGSSDWYGLGPISVLPEFQRWKIGTRLMTNALAELRRLGAAGCVLLGNPRFYGRFGFKPEPGLILTGLPPELFLALRFAGEIPSGTVSYHRSFGV